MRAPIRQFTELAPSAQGSGGPTFAAPGSMQRGPSPAAQPQPQPQTATAARSAASSASPAPYMAAGYEGPEPGQVQPAARDNSAPRGRRRPAPRPRPNYAGFDSAESGQGDLRQPAPAPASSAPGDSPPSAAPDPAGFAPVYAEGPRRAHAAPRPHAHADPGASSNNLPRPRHRADAHAEPVAPHKAPAAPDPAYPSSSPAWGSPQAQPRSALRLVLVGRDGQEGESFPIPPHGAEIGRSGTIAFPSDPFVSPQHVRITPIEGGVHLADLGSRNGVYLRLTEPTAVYPGDFFLLGNQLLRLGRLETPWQERPLDAHDVRGFGTPAKPPWAVLTRLCVGEIEDDRYHLRGTEITIGREQGEIVFPSDGFLSRSHARVRMEIHDNTMTVVLEDLDSANGTYLRIRGAVNVPYGGMFRVGDQIFRLRM
ncbi:MAG: FHA domain-containing protein [Enhygromyxa sp.]